MQFYGNLADNLSILHRLFEVQSSYTSHLSYVFKGSYTQAHIRVHVNIRPQQEIEPKVGDGPIFHSGLSFTSIRYRRFIVDLFPAPFHYYYMLLISNEALSCKTLSTLQLIASDHQIISCMLQQCNMHARSADLRSYMYSMSKRYQNWQVMRLGRSRLDI